MPKTSTGWLLDDSPMFTPEEWAQIQQLIKDGKDDEAAALMDKILKEKDDKP